jgi:hypothetical protein
MLGPRHANITENIGNRYYLYLKIWVTDITYIFRYVSMTGSQHAKHFKDSFTQRPEDDPHVGSKHVAYWNQPYAIKVAVLNVPFISFDYN